MAFTNTISVYDRYSSTGQIPILKSDFTKMARDASNVQKYFATNSTVNQGRHIQLLLAYQSTGTNQEATATPATNIALRHLKNGTMIASGSISLGSSLYANKGMFAISDSAICSPVFGIIASTSYSFSDTSLHNKYFHFGYANLSAQGVGVTGKRINYNTGYRYQLTSAAMGATAISLSIYYGVDILPNTNAYSTSVVFADQYSLASTAIAAGNGAVDLYFNYKFFACDIEE